MNILHISTVKTWGGGEHHLENLCTELKKVPQVRNLVLCAEGGKLSTRLKNLGIPTATAPLLFKADPRFVLRIGEICTKHRFDLIHIHDSTALAITVMANYLFSLPTFVFSKKTSFPIKQRKQTLFKYNHPKLQKILCVSELTKKIASEAIKDKAKLQTLYHGTRMDNKSTDTPFRLREKFQIPRQVKIIGHIGNHIRAKDLLTWVRTIDFLINKQQRKDIIFVQIGAFTDEFTPQIKAEIERLKLSKNVHLLKYLPNASNFIDQFDTLLLTSASEGLPQVILEAFFHKVPVVSTNVGGIPEVIDDGENGFLAPAGDFQLLGRHLLTLFEDEELSQQFRENSFQKLYPTFTTENMAKQTFEVYQALVPHSQSLIPNPELTK